MRSCAGLAVESKSGILSEALTQLAALKKLSIVAAKTPCPLCAEGQGLAIGHSDRRGDPLLTLLCPGCGLARTDPLPTLAELREFYQKRYRLAYKGTETPKRKHVYRAGRVALNRIASMRGFLREGARVLDVGSGGGEMVFLLRAAGCDASGIEPNLGYARYAREQLGLNVKGGMVQDLDHPPASLDAITLFHVLEHTNDPVGFLKRLRCWLRPGGYLFVEVPNLEGREQHPARRFHTAHLVHFNVATLHWAGGLAGFSAERTVVSGDGGVVFVIFRERSDGPASTDPPGPNYARLKELEQRQTPGRYYFSTATVVRTFRRLTGMLAELAAIGGKPAGRAILESLAAQPSSTTLNPSR